MAAIACSSNTSAAMSSLSSSSTVKARGPICSLPCPNFFWPKFCSNPTLPRLKISRRKREASKHVLRVPIVSCLVDDSFEEYPELGQASVANDSSPEATIDIKLPRRSLLVQFTCTACGERSQKLINRLAYERGTVFIQCSGCLKYHRLIDNLNLVVEYNFRDDISLDSDADQV